MRTGALRATSNAGLQPALDFLFAHTDDPIPDVSAQSQAQPSSSTSRAGGGDEDDEELEANIVDRSASIHPPQCASARTEAHM